MGSLKSRLLCCKNRVDVEPEEEFEDNQLPDRERSTRPTRKIDSKLPKVIEINVDKGFRFVDSHFYRLLATCVIKQPVPLGSPVSCLVFTRRMILSITRVTVGPLEFS